MDDISECYRILDLEPGASLEDVKRSYRELVRVWHPDRFRNDPKLQAKAEEKMKRINLAYEWLCYEAAASAARNTAPQQPPKPSPPRTRPEPRATHARSAESRQSHPDQARPRSADAGGYKAERFARWIRKPWVTSALVAFAFIVIGVIVVGSRQTESYERVFVTDLSGLDSRQHDAKGGFSIRPPRDWIVIPELEGPQGERGFLAVAAPIGGFAPNITVLKGTFPTTPRECEVLVKTEVSPTPRKRIETTILVAATGTEIVRILTEKFHPGKGYEMRYTFYSIHGRHGQNFRFTFTCPVAQADQFQTLADACVASFEEK